MANYITIKRLIETLQQLPPEQQELLVKEIEVDQLGAPVLKLAVPFKEKDKNR